MRLWRNVIKGCKYLVVRRDGTIPMWAHFVLGERDPSAPAGLRGYADDAEKQGRDPEYVSDIRRMADEWEIKLKCGVNTPGDPDAAPHRTDDPRVIDLMANKGIAWTEETKSQLETKLKIGGGCGKCGTQSDRFEEHSRVLTTDPETGQLLGVQRYECPVCHEVYSVGIAIDNDGPTAYHVSKV